MRVRSEDLPLALRVFWGPGGLQSDEEGPNSREDPGMDDPIVSPARSLCGLFMAAFIIVLQS